MNEMSKVKMSERLESLMLTAKRARETVMCGQYSNGSYSAAAGYNAKSALDMIERELHSLMKEAIRSEAVADTKDQIIAQFTVQIH